MSRVRAPEWSENELNRLGELAIQYVSSGHTLSEACEAFEKETNGLRTFSSARYKFQTKVLPRIREQYELARRKGTQVIMEQRRQQQEQQQQQLDEDDEERITQRELLRYLRRVRIVDEEAESLRRQVELLHEQLEQVSKERDEWKNKYVHLEAKYKEVENERDQLANAIAIARKFALNLPDAGAAKITVGPDGLVESVATRERD
jgi:uncharacterized coiled-coil DUF342 family protein